eukprot:748319-Hanusia_phi.AAC.2
MEVEAEGGNKESGNRNLKKFPYKNCYESMAKATFDNYKAPASRPTAHPCVTATRHLADFLTDPQVIVTATRQRTSLFPIQSIAQSESSLLF